MNIEQRTMKTLTAASIGMQLACGAIMILAGVKNCSYLSAYLGAFILVLASFEVKDNLSELRPKRNLPRFKDPPPPPPAADDI
jgi:hypothetical protein